MFTVTHRNFSEWIQRQKPSDPRIILGIHVMRQAGIQHSDDIMGYPNRLLVCIVEYGLAVASIFNFRTIGQWEYCDYYTVVTFCTSFNIVSAIG